MNSRFIIGQKVLRKRTGSLGTLKYLESEPEEIIDMRIDSVGKMEYKLYEYSFWCPESMLTLSR